MLPPCAKCPQCQGPLVAIKLPVEGHDLEMRSCSRCDTRFWQEAGKDIDLSDVLGRDLAYQPALR